MNYSNNRDPRLRRVNLVLMIYRSARKDFKKHPCKLWPVEGCSVTLGENPDVFMFHNIQRCKL